MVHYSIHEISPPVPILIHNHPVHAPSHFSNIHLNIILPSMLWSPLGFPHRNFVCTSTLPHTCYMQMSTIYFLGFIYSIPCIVIYLLNETNKMHIHYIFFRFMHLHVSVLGDHSEGAHCYRIHKSYYVQIPTYKYLQ
jgi:hypothetical protein